MAGMPKILLASEHKPSFPNEFSQVVTNQNRKIRNPHLEPLPIAVVIPVESGDPIAPHLHHAPSVEQQKIG